MLNAHRGRQRHLSVRLSIAVQPGSQADAQKAQQLGKHDIAMRRAVQGIQISEKIWELDMNGEISIGDYTASRRRVRRCRFMAAHSIQVARYGKS